MLQTDFAHVTVQRRCETAFYRVFLSCVPTVVPNSTKVMDEEKKFRDCADLYQAGFHKNAVYTIQISSQETKKVGSSEPRSENIGIFLTFKKHVRSRFMLAEVRFIFVQVG